MSSGLAVFVKTPGLSMIKTRLAKDIGKGGAQEFYARSLKAIEATLAEFDGQAYWAVGEKAGVHNPLWMAFPALHTGEGGLGERQSLIYDALLERHDKAILIGADTPQISMRIINRAIQALDQHDFVIGPAHDGGYYLFGGSKPLSQEIWISVKYSRSTTRDGLLKALPSKPHMLDALTDVDHAEDIAAMLKEMPAHPNDGQQNIIKWAASF